MIQKTTRVFVYLFLTATLCLVGCNNASNRTDHLFYACRFAHWQAKDKKRKEAFLQDAIVEAERSGDKDKSSLAYSMQASFFYDERWYPEVIEACRKWEAVDSLNRAVRSICVR